MTRLYNRAAAHVDAWGRRGLRSRHRSATRDRKELLCDWNGVTFRLVDTGGVDEEDSGPFGRHIADQARAAIADADLVLFVVDARSGITPGDEDLAAILRASGKPVVVLANKIDDPRRDLDAVEFHRLGLGDPVPLSALHGSNIHEVFRAAARAAEAAHAELATPELTRVLADVVATHPPPLVRRHRIRLTYAHQGGRRPPLIVVHGTQTELLPDSYRRYLVNRFRAAFGLVGTPIRLELRTARNPYAGRRNPLTRRQARKRRRLR